MRRPIKAANLSASADKRKNRGVEFVRSTDWPENGYFLIDGHLSKDVQFRNAADSIHWITAYHKNHKTKAQFLAFDPEGWLYEKTDYDAEGHEIHRVRFRDTNHSLESETFTGRNPGEGKTVWYYDNGQPGAEYRFDPRESSAANQYWDERGRPISQEQFCKARFGVDWQQAFGQEGERNKETNIKGLKEEMSRFRK